MGRGHKGDALRSRKSGEYEGEGGTVEIVQCRVLENLGCVERD